ncbi:MAG: uracil phosphoribosyltransferase [Candidatus Binatia bacterium]
MKNVNVINHPLAQQKLARLRDCATDQADFRRLLGDVALFLAYEATRDLATKPTVVETPLAQCKGRALKHKILLVPILRAGLGMLDAALRIIPEAQTGFIGLKRDESTLEPISYYSNVPDDLRSFDVILMDPMLATGGSAIAALDLLIARRAKRVRMINLLAAPEGIRKLRKHYPDLPVFTAAIDKRLNEIGYIFPGLGDAGDRQFNG